MRDELSGIGLLVGLLQLAAKCMPYAIGCALLGRDSVDGVHKLQASVAVASQLAA